MRKARGALPLRLQTPEKRERRTTPGLRPGSSCMATAAAGPRAATALSCWGKDLGNEPGNAGNDLHLPAGPDHLRAAEAAGDRAPAGPRADRIQARVKRVQVAARAGNPGNRVPGSQ